MRAQRGQASNEYTLLISVIVIAVVASAYVFVPGFRDGTSALAQDASEVLDTGRIGEIGNERTRPQMKKSYQKAYAPMPCFITADGGGSCH